MAAAVLGIISFVNAVLNFKSDKTKRNKNIIRFVVSAAVFYIFWRIKHVHDNQPTPLRIKYVYDNRAEIEKTAVSLITTAIDKTVEYTMRGAIATASTFTKTYNSNVIKQFENLDISCSSSKFEIADGKKIYEIELMLDNRIQRNEEIYFGSLVQKNYLIACDADSGFIKDQSLIALVEFFVGREYTKFGKIMPGKTLHKILVAVPEAIEISYLQFLDKK
ncbi:MAG: hypothetical protein Pg6C_03540 [Treponemataceae bacterium]|nr:MAG: hypothetical protein Pg6C_03540 [Treponemataceae bacterium]